MFLLLDIEAIERLWNPLWDYSFKKPLSPLRRKLIPLCASTQERAEAVLHGVSTYPTEMFYIMSSGLPPIVSSEDLQSVYSSATESHIRCDIVKYTFVANVVRSDHIRVTYISLITNVSI